MIGFNTDFSTPVPKTANPNPEAEGAHQGAGVANVSHFEEGATGVPTRVPPPARP